MSIKIFDDENQSWKKVGIAHALNVEVEDMGGKFKTETKSVENCLGELKDDVTEMKKNIDYIYQNGTIGGGNGGPGVVPTITLKGEDQYVIKPDETIDIRFYFSSPNPGNGKAICRNGDDVTEMVVTKGVEYKWVVGPFKRGKYTLSIMAEDRQGIFSEPVLIGVKSGALSIETEFDGDKEFAPSEEVTIPYNIISDIEEPVFVDLKLNDNEVKTIEGNIGTNTWEIGTLPLMGINKASMKARNSKYESNTLNFTLVAADSTKLTLSTTFDTKVVSLGKTTVIPYRISKLGELSFYVDYVVDEKIVSTIETRKRVNYWDATPFLDVLGDHKMKIVARTTDGIHRAEVEFPLTVVATDFTPQKEVTSGLIAKFDAKGKLNGSSNQNVWEDKSGKNVRCDLYNFNYATNGWIQDPVTGETELRFNGKTYAVIDLPIFQQDIGQQGFTFDVLYKTKNVGDKDAKILQCRNIHSPYQGIEIDTEQAIFGNRNSQSVNSLFAEDIWTRQTFVIDRTQNKVFVYTNAINSGFSILTAGATSDFNFNGKIILGAGYGSMTANGEGSNPTNFANGSIKKIRIYNRSLSATEILQNHISDMNFENQEKTLALNEESQIGAPVGMPYINIKGLMEGIETNGAERDGYVEYWDPYDTSKSMTQQCKFSIQGTSSKEYNIKNYTIKLFEGSVPYTKWAPKDDWLPEPRWTIKANYMDSSHANNIGTNKFIHDFNIKQNRTYPSQITNPKCRSNVDGFPVAVLINGKFDGVYTFNIDRYAPHNYGFVTSYNDNGTPNNHKTAVSYEIAANSTNGAGAFLDDSWDSIKTEFKHRYNWRGDESHVTVVERGQTVLAEGQHKELQDLITWVKNTDGDEFYKELKDHFSVPHLIDYFLIAYVLGMADKQKLSAVNLL